MRQIFHDPVLQKEFDHTGYVVVDFLNEEELAALISTYAQVRDQFIVRPFSVTSMSMDTHCRNKASAAITNAFSRAAGVYFDRSQIFKGIFTAKQPGSDQSSLCPIHQDPAYVDEAAYHGITIWVPLTDTDAGNGALEVIDRSHLLNTYPRSTLPHFPYKELTPLLLKKYFKTLNIKAGQAYLGSAKLFHWSPPNYSATERAAALAWLSEEESTLRCYYQDYTNPGDTVEVFEVPPSHYLEQPLFGRPDLATSTMLGTIPYQHEPLDESKIDAIVCS